MNGPGRPSLYSPEFFQRAHRHCAEGGTNATLARLFGVGTATIGRWIEQHEEFAAAVLDGKALADAGVQSALFGRAVGRPHPAVKVVWLDGRPQAFEYLARPLPDVRACHLWLRNRQPGEWRDRPAEPAGDGEELKRILDEASERAARVTY